jgi:hypothetical protein
MKMCHQMVAGNCWMNSEAVLDALLIGHHHTLQNQIHLKQTKKHGVQIPRLVYIENIFCMTL